MQGRVRPAGKRCQRAVRAALAVGVAGTIALTAPADAGTTDGGWSATEGVTPSNYNDSVAAAFTDDGSGAVLYITNQGSSELRSMVRTGTDGAWVDGGRITRTYAPDMDVVATGDGELAAVWMAKDRLHLRRWSSTWGETDALRVAGSGLIRIAGGPDGQVVAAARRSDDTWLVVTHDEDEGWRRAPLAFPNHWVDDVEISPEGDVVVALTELSSRQETGALVLARRSGAGAWELEQVPAAEGRALDDVRLALGDDDELAVVVRESDLGSSEPGDVAVWTTTQSGLGRHDLPQSDQRDCSRTSTCADVAFFPDGEAVLVWSRGTSAGKGSAHVARRLPDGQWSAPKRLPFVTSTSVDGLLPRDDGSFAVQGWEELLTCDASRSCTSIGVPDGLVKPGKATETFVAAGDGGEVHVAFSYLDCDLRCYARVSGSDWRPES